MKNDESHGSKKQELQRQADKLLPIITDKLAQLGYGDIAHQRLSQQNGNSELYQGLTRAADSKLEQVMIKWEISANIYYDLTSLGHEIKVLKALNSFQLKTQNAITISAPVLTDKSSIIKLFNKNYQLTLLVMPYYRQVSLAKYLKQSLTEPQKYQLIVKVANLINSLHQSAWLHNDIKPSNILINNDDSLLLTDFALAKRIAADTDTDTDIYTEVKIKAEHSAGTPAYLAPERWQGHSATLQSDIYAFGIMMYEIVVGERPFAIDSSNSEPFKQWAVMHCQQPVLVLPFHYNHYQMLIDRLLAKQVEQRYSTMNQVLEDLRLLRKV